MNWDELSCQSLPWILDWAAGQPWCHAMAACQQDAGWHSEGDVWTHTQMVCHQLPQLPEWSGLTSHEQTILIFTALFHDAGKPLTSRQDPVTGRITSPRHSIKGEHLARSILRDLDCGLDVREEIARMVRYHGRPAFLLDRPEPAHEVIGLSWSVVNRLLYLFTLADYRGRRMGEPGRSEEILHLWKGVAEEQGCLDRRYPFANDQARFLFFRQPASDLHYVPHEDYRCTVTLMSGLPGSGKDTWLARHRPELPVVSLDTIRSELEISPLENQGEVAQLAMQRCRELLRSGSNFAFNATNLMQLTRQRWINLFADYGARVEAVYLEPRLSTILRRNSSRPHRVPDSVIRELAEKCEPPTWTEVHHLTLISGEKE